MIKRSIRKLANQFGIDLVRLPTPPDKLVQQYLTGDKQPWTSEYMAYKNYFITQTLDDKNLLAEIRKSKVLPETFGYGIDERCVEYPWVFAMSDDKAETILDAGSALNHDYILDRDYWGNKNLTIYTLAPEVECHWQHGISYQYGDLCAMPYQDNWFDEVICVSTLEHVGMDNRYYTKERNKAEENAEEYLHAVAEIKRVLKPGGRLLLTVPYGKQINYGMFQQFDKSMLERVIDTFKPVFSDISIFAYSKSGWHHSDDENCHNLEYSQYAMSLWPDNIKKQPDHDNAAAARSVACLVLEKGQ